MPKVPSPKHQPPGLVASIIRRARSMYVVAEPWERVFVLSAPFWVVLIACYHLWGLPVAAAAFLYLFLALYMVAWFIFLVVLERRAGEQAQRRFRAHYLNSMDLKTAREAKQREAEQQRLERQAARAARASGRKDDD